MKSIKILGTIVLVLSITAFVFISDLKLKLQNHYDIEKSSMTWKRLFGSKKVLNKFPLYESISKETYEYQGYDHTPYSIQTWEISYKSGMQKESLIKLYIEYFKEYNIILKEGTTRCGPIVTGYPNTEYFGSEKGNCRILAIDSIKQDETFVLFSYWR